MYTTGDHVKILKYKNIFAKGYARNRAEEVFVISKMKNTVSWTYVINDFNGEEIIVTFYAKELQKTIQNEFSIEKVINEKKVSYMSNEKDMLIHLMAGLIK